MKYTLIKDDQFVEAYVNLTPHAIKLNDGTDFPPSGEVLRIPETWERVATEKNIFERRVGNLDFKGPDKIDGYFPVYIVSAMVLSAIRRIPVDLLKANGLKGKLFVAPATGHPDTVRDDKGHIVSVPGWVLE